MPGMQVYSLLFGGLLKDAVLRVCCVLRFAIFVNVAPRVPPLLSFCACFYRVFVQFEPKRESYVGTPATYSVTFDEDGYASKITVSTAHRRALAGYVHHLSSFMFDAREVSSSMPDRSLGVDAGGDTPLKRHSGLNHSMVVCMNPVL